MSTLVFVNVICRYVLQFSIAWCDEISSFLMIWVCFMGAALAYVKNEHIGLDLVAKKLPPQPARAMAIFVDLATLYCVYLIGYGGYQIMIQTLAWRAPASGLPYAYVYLAVPLSMLLFLVLAVQKLYWHVMSLIRNRNLPEEGV